MIARSTKLSLCVLIVALTFVGAMQFRHSPVPPHERLVVHREGDDSRHSERLPEKWEGEAPAEPQTDGKYGSAGALPSPKSASRIASDNAVLRVGTFNIHGGKGGDGRRDLARTARCLAELDVVGLNEVRGDWFAWQADQALQLGRILKMDAVFAPSEQIGWFDRFGNGLLSRLELTSVQRIPLPGTQHKRFRNAVLTGIRWRGEVIRLLAVHVDSTRDRATQLELVSDLFLSLAEPAILMGDFNTRADDSTLQRLLASPGVVDVLSEAKSLDLKPASHIDWILVRGLKVVQAELRDDGASDHPVVRAELKLKDDNASRDLE
jgi:endonuclease/exonuclease/phosphatase family metal-dependent hydrolase